MRFSGRLALLGLITLLSCLLSVSGLRQRAEEQLQQRAQTGRMRNIEVLDGPVRPAADSAAGAEEPDAQASAEASDLTPSSVAPSPLPAPAAEPDGPSALPAGEAEGPLLRVISSAGEGELRQTTIPGGLSLKNETAYVVDPQQLLAEGPRLSLPAEGPQVLIVHTHGSEAYTPAGLDLYEASDAYRTEDPRSSVIRVGDELAARLEAQGLSVLHDRGLYDSPSYTGSYSRSAEAVEGYLARYPQIAVVIDLHRDALGADGVIYKTMAEEPGTVASQVMLLVGTDESGLEHPNWRANLSLALYLQDAVGRVHPTLMRPVDLVPQRYNQHLAPGALILEVGSNGNTLQEALAAIRLFADAAGPALLELVEQPEAETP